jgi:hypothetical protein
VKTILVRGEELTSNLSEIWCPIGTQSSEG